MGTTTPPISDRSISRPPHAWTRMIARATHLLLVACFSAGCLRPLSRPACGASLLTLRGSSAQGPETWKWTSAGFAQAEISPMAEGYLWVRNVEVIIGEAQVECQLGAASRVRPKLLRSTDNSSRARVSMAETHAEKRSDRFGIPLAQIFGTHPRISPGVSNLDADAKNQGADRR